MSKVLVETVFSNASKIPTSTESKDRSRGIIKWGDKNDYPLYLVDLRNEAATHGGIIRGKVNYIAGKGIKVVAGELAEWLAQPYNDDHDMNDIVQAMVDDLETFGMMAVKGTWNMTGERVAKWEYIDMSALRVSEDKTTWKFSEDWTASRQDDSVGFKSYPAFDKDTPIGAFVMVWMLPFKKGRGEKGYYGKPPYSACITDADTERQISVFHRNNIYNGFKLGTLVNFSDGMPESEEEAKKIAAKLRDDASAMDNAGGIKVTFSNGKDKAPEAISLTGDDLSERYLQTAEYVEKNIVKGHSAVSGMLFGVKTAGQLGGTTEMEDSWELLKKSYVESRQKFISKALNEMVSLSGYTGTVEVEGADFLAPKQEVEQKAFEAEKDPVIEAFKTIGRSKEGLNIVHRAAIGKDLGLPDVSEFERQQFDVIGQVIAKMPEFDRNVLGLVKDNQDGSSIAKALDSKLGEVGEALERLRQLGALTKNNKVTSLGNDIVDKAEIPIEEFEVLYSYEVRPDVPAAKQSREFCTFLIDRNLVYTREEIEMISARVDRDVWRYRGGYYTNPKTGDTTPWCRHFWQLNLVRK
jgi:hypothetical protein